MTASRSSATSDPMAALCLIGRAVRGAGELNLLLQLMFIATCSPLMKHALLAWLSTEERFAGLEFEPEPGVIEAGWGGPDGYYPARTTPRGRVVLWRHVTRFGLAVMVPLVVAPPVAFPGQRVPSLGWSVTRRLSSLSFFKFFAPGLAFVSNCVLIVTESY